MIIVKLQFFSCEAFVRNSKCFIPKTNIFINNIIALAEATSGVWRYVDNVVVPYNEETGFVTLKIDKRILGEFDTDLILDVLKDSVHYTAKKRKFEIRLFKYVEVDEEYVIGGNIVDFYDDDYSDSESESESDLENPIEPNQMYRIRGSDPRNINGGKRKWSRRSGL